MTSKLNEDVPRLETVFLWKSGTTEDVANASLSSSDMSGYRSSVERRRRMLT
jgi:hypothetical protein